MDLSKMTNDELDNYAIRTYEWGSRMDLQLATELATRLRAAEADRDTYKARAEAAEKVVAKVGDWYHNAESARDITDEGTFRPTEDDENALADAIEAYWTDQAARTPTPKETTR